MNKTLAKMFYFELLHVLPLDGSASRCPYEPKKDAWTEIEKMLVIEFSSTQILHKNPQESSFENGDFSVFFNQIYSGQWGTK